MLIAEGHNVENLGAGVGSSEGEQVKDKKQLLRREEAQSISAAPVIPEEEFERLNKKLTRTEEERAKIQKYLLSQELPGVDLTLEFVHKAVTKDGRRWLNAQKLWWYGLHPTETTNRDRAILYSKLKMFNVGIAFIPDIKTLSLQIKALQEVGILSFASAA